MIGNRRARISGSGAAASRRSFRFETTRELHLGIRAVLEGLVDMMPPDTNRGPSFPGRPIRLGGRKSVTPTCRDEVLAAFTILETRCLRPVFSVGEVYAEMVAEGTRYAESTVAKTMQRMKNSPARPPYARLERAGRAGFRLPSVET